ncbi:DUF6086 family protein, partial [Kibdelosporangium lantanae]
MSQYFEVGEETLWNPSNGPGILFARTARAMESIAGVPCGIGVGRWGPGDPDCHSIDLPVFTAFTDQGIRVYLDFHQDLYSRYLFNKDSWYTGDGAPAWLVQAGNYPKESCGLCFHWGQNMKSNKAVIDATYDFWHNRQVGDLRFQDAFLAQAAETMRYLRTSLSPDAFTMLLGVDPLNEPYAGHYDTGQTSLAWERDLLWPFYQRFRRAMDDSGWTTKAAFVEPLVFWNNNVSFFAEPGGLTEVPALGDRYVFNSHFYDGAAQSGILKPGKAVDGEYARDFAGIRDRAAA